MASFMVKEWKGDKAPSPVLDRWHLFRNVIAGDKRQAAIRATNGRQCGRYTVAVVSADQFGADGKPNGYSLVSVDRV